MNERIRELALQAGIHFGLGATLDGNDIARFVTTSDMEKFAELIIKECAGVAQDFVTVENNKLVEHVHISPWHLQDKIKEHFGVE